MPETTAAAPVSDKRTPATGVIPKQMQSWIFLSVILVAAVGLWFSTSAKPKTNSGSASTPAEPIKSSVGGLSPDEVQRRLQEIEDARRRALKDAPPNKPGQSTNPSAPDANTDATPPGANAPPQSNPPVGDPIADDERKREYVSRFASNVALSYRTDSRPASSAMPDVTATAGASGHPE